MKEIRQNEHVFVYWINWLNKMLQKKPIILTVFSLLCSSEKKKNCSYLIDAPWWHGAVVEAQEGSYGFLTASPVTLTPQVQRVVVPHYCVRQTGGQTGVQVRFVLTQACLCGQKPGRTGTWQKYVHILGALTTESSACTSSSVIASLICLISIFIWRYLHNYHKQQTGWLVNYILHHVPPG